MAFSSKLFRSNVNSYTISENKHLSDKKHLTNVKTFSFRAEVFSFEDKVPFSL